jgi:hypothetical protein
MEKGTLMGNYIHDVRLSVPAITYGLEYYKQISNRLLKNPTTAVGSDSQSVFLLSSSSKCGQRWSRVQGVLQSFRGYEACNQTLILSLRQ